jgi:hypothetical protein
MIRTVHKITVDDILSFHPEVEYASATTADGRYRKRLSIAVAGLGYRVPDVVFRVMKRDVTTLSDNEVVYEGESLKQAVETYNELG